MIGILVDDDRIGVPDPIRDVGIVGGRDAEVEAAEPEPARPTTLQTKNVPRAEAACEMAVFPWMVEMEAAIVHCRMPDPGAVGVYVRRIRVPFEIPEVVFLSTVVLHVILRHAALFPARPLLRHTMRLRWCRSMRRNKSAAHAAPFGRTLLVFPLPKERQRSN